MKNYLSILLFCTLGTGVTFSTSASAQYYSVTELGPYSDSLCCASYGFGLNSLGQVVGQAGSDYLPFITGSNGVNAAPFAIAGATYVDLRGINDSGQIIGTAYPNAANQATAFITGPNATGVTYLGTLGYTGNAALAVNNSGQVAGYLANSPSVGSDYSAFITGANGSGTINLGATLGGQESQAVAINNNGQATGFVINSSGIASSFITGANGVGVTVLSTPQNYYANSASAINSFGQIAGTLTAIQNGATVSQAFITGSNGVGITPIANLQGLSSQATGINDEGRVVGDLVGPNGQLAGGFVTGPNGTGITNLSTIDGGLGFVEVIAINNAGQILAEGGNDEAYLLSETSIAPAPEPATYAMLISGLCLMGAFARRKAKD
jgi:uncharacterized membrane protein